MKTQLFLDVFLYKNNYQVLRTILGTQLCLEICIILQTKRWNIPDGSDKFPN